MSEVDITLHADMLEAVAIDQARNNRSMFTSKAFQLMMRASINENIDTDRLDDAHERAIQIVNGIKGSKQL